jgi:hypothetical protein
MKRSRSFETPASAGAAQRARRRLGILAGAALVTMLMVPFAGSASLAASPSPQQGQAKEKKYKATRAVVVDKQTGEVRLPTQQEVDSIVASLSSLGQRPDDTLQDSTSANGAVVRDLDGGFGGILLGRPNGDGTFETKCVFTLEEGADFLGIVPDDSAR